MKLCIAENLDKPSSGKHKFLSRLTLVCKKQGIRIVNNNADVLLHIGRNITGLKAKKVIMRIDGLLFNKEKPYEKMNNKIMKYINKSDALIYQGQFCKEAYQRFLNVDKSHACIYNGAAKSEFLNRNVKNYFLTHCNWRPHKRLKDTCNGFLLALEQGLDADLIVAGKTEQEVKHKRIKYVGWVGPEYLKKMLSEAIATIHLAWLDWCPNAMIESIIAGCPVIYSDSGGSPEIGRDAGLSIKDTAWDFKPCYHYKPPSLVLDEIVDALITLKNERYHIQRDDLLIENVGKKYIDFFYKVLNERH